MFAVVYGAFLLASLIFLKQFFPFVVARARLTYYVEQINGPYSIPILGTVWQFKWNLKELVLQMREWGLYYSKGGKGLVRMWIGPRPMVFAIRPETAKIILESNEVITKGPEYDILVPWLGTGLLIATGDKWRQRRKLLTPSFHFNILMEFQSIFDYQSRVLIEQLEPLAKAGEIFDAFPYIKRCALDIICETAMGATVSAQVNHSHPYVLAVQKMNTLAFQHARMPWLQIRLISHVTGYQHEYDTALRIVSDFTKKVIEERTREFDRHGGWHSEGKKAFLDMLIEMSKEGNLGYEDIREEVDTFMFEGHDTTASGMGWTLWCLAHNPDCQKKAHEELDRVFDGSSRDCTVDDLKQLKYLEMCAKEALRLRPSVPMMTRFVEKDFMLGEQLIPKGTSLVISPMMIHTNPDVYERAEQYDPERFTEANTAKRHPYAYVPFSAGPRNCIGQKFALQEEKTVLSWILRKYEISAVLPYFENIPLPEIINRPAAGFPLAFHRRTI